MCSAAAARLQALLPDAVLVGGSAASAHAGHRVSFDDDHVLTDLESRFDDVLSQLEKEDELDDGARQPTRADPRQPRRRRDGDPAADPASAARGRRIAGPAGPIRVPTLPGDARIKAWLVLRRNATRDYLDLSLSPTGSARRRRRESLSSSTPTTRTRSAPAAPSRRAAREAARGAGPDDLSEVDLRHIAARAAVAGLERGRRRLRSLEPPMLDPPLRGNGLMRHRHLDVDPTAPPAELGLAALDDLLERGDLDDWRPSYGRSAGPAERARGPGAEPRRAAPDVRHVARSGAPGSWSSVPGKRQRQARFMRGPRSASSDSAEA